MGKQVKMGRENRIGHGHGGMARLAGRKPRDGAADKRGCFFLIMMMVEKDDTHLSVKPWLYQQI